MKKQLLFALILLFSFTSAFAQPGMKKKIQQSKELKEKTLLVPIEDSEFGTRLKAAVEDVWTFNENVKFVTEEEFKTFKKNKKERDNYAYLNYFWNGQSGLYPGNVVKVSFLGKVAPIYYVAVTSKYTRNLKSSDPTRVVSLNTKETITKADLLFAVLQLQTYIESFCKYKKVSKKEMMKSYQEQLKNVVVLKDKNLLIEKSSLSAKALKKIESIYKYDYEIVSKEILDDAILNNHEGIAYVKGTPQVQPPMRVTGNEGTKGNFGTLTMTTFAIYDSNGNELLFGFFPEQGGNTLSDKDLKNLAKALN